MCSGQDLRRGAASELALGSEAFPTIVDGTFDVAEVGPLPSVIGVLNGKGGPFREWHSSWHIMLQ